ncbi:PIN domain-containing protein [Modestobacter sp. I12A-02628]|uniref:Ribonuclease VapC n=1 Tax=Goekera deserti TaxID=2497753 RepID=A0A7K3WGZ7_9ACTN|nr:type II toxin-antitoxin system VapC family toxin [Goekera deserti]MPQ99705.1 PIN domain-containing protein [Goekera deserti]NDI46285.1 PIN domain-containing protein [Goekera deserti]NEL54783.1 type II toxin-antitoxin system VapC family toxin [Goekera deserti]
MTVVLDASAAVAALVDDGPDGRWARSVLADEVLTCPAHLLVEVSSVLRRSVLGGRLPREVAGIAHRALVDMPLTTFPFEPFAARVWALHPDVTAYDAGYVALAEALEAPLVTLDRRLTRAGGPTCAFLVP